MGTQPLVFLYPIVPLIKDQRKVHFCLTVPNYARDGLSPVPRLLINSVSVHRQATAGPGRRNGGAAERAPSTALIPPPPPPRVFVDRHERLPVDSCCRSSSSDEECCTFLDVPVGGSLLVKHNSPNMFGHHAVDSDCCHAATETLERLYVEHETHPSRRLSGCSTVSEPVVCSRNGRLPGGGWPPRSADAPYDPSAWGGSSGHEVTENTAYNEADQTSMDRHDKV